MEFSEVNNDEMGLLVSLKEDRRLYDLTDEVLIVEGSRDAPIEDSPGQNRAECSESVDSKVMAQADRTSRVAPKDRNVTDGQTTIQTFRSKHFLDLPQGCHRKASASGARTEVPTDPSQAILQTLLYNLGVVREPGAYEEKHCHTCGSEHTSTLLKPVCLSCYRKYKDVFEFAVG